STFHPDFSKVSLTAQDYARILIIALLFSFSAIFWMAFEQAGSSLNLFADTFVKNEIFGFSFPSSWLQAVNPIFIILLAPLFSWVWMKLAARQPGSAVKFSLGLLFAALGFYLLAYASRFVGEGKVSFFWLLGVYFLHTCGELCVSPVGLSMVTRLAPKQLVAFFLGVWFVSIALGNYLGGVVASHFSVDSGNLVNLFNTVGYICLSASIVLLLLYPVFKRLERKGSRA
ncbi:MAG: oligopeptide:H+ symporter, partial [Parachlamydiaceae bacterium]